MIFLWIIIYNSSRIVVEVNVDLVIILECWYFLNIFFFLVWKCVIVECLCFLCDIFEGGKIEFCIKFCDVFIIGFLFYLYLNGLVGLF